LRIKDSQNFVGIKRWAVLSLILLCLSWRVALPINLISIDLGRHIKNGELILQGTWEVLYKNYYSYTNPGYPFINHHWFFGVLCYLIWQSFGFAGISFLFIIIRLATFWIFFRLAERFSSFPIACAIGLLSFPLVASRIDIRPELLSALFSGLFWWLLDSYKQGRITSGRLKGWLIVLQIIWVNTHIFFIMGPVLITFFWLQAKIENKKQESIDFKQVIWLTMGACLVNPSGLNGAFLPLSLFQGFHTDLLENIPLFSSIKFISRDLWRCFMVSLESLLICWIFFLKSHEVKKNITGILLVILISSAALFANRLITLFGYFWIPLISYACSGWMQDWSSTFRKYTIIVLLVLGVLVAMTVGFDRRQQPAFGLAPGVNDSAVFFEQNKLSGPIFNNYEIGGYLIFHLSHSYKLFVDNRAEAYPKDFFDNVIDPAEADNKNWLKLDQKYHFNTIFFHLSWFNDYDEGFIYNRILDHDWAPVFIDNDVFIFVRRNEQNINLIRRYESDTAKIMKRFEVLGITPENPDHIKN